MGNITKCEKSQNMKCNKMWYVAKCEVLQNMNCKKVEKCRKNVECHQM